MNIIFFMQDTGAVFGAERATIDLAHGLRDAGDSVSFFLIDESARGISPALAQSISAAGFTVKRFPVRGRVSFRLARQLRQAFGHAGGHVLHALGYKANVHAYLSGVRPLVTTVHGWLFHDDLKEKFYHGVECFCQSRCDRVICLSHFYEDLLLRSGIHPDRLDLIPSGLRELPATHVKPISRSGAPVTFGMLGRFSEEKNHELFLRAAKKVHQQRPGVRFHIAGSGPREQAIRSQCAALGLGDAVTFAGYTDVARYFDDIDVYVICSKIENLPYSVLEAMARQRPVIGTRVGGIPDLIGHGDNGLLVDGGDVDGLAAAVLALAEDPVLIAKMGARGLVKLQQEFDFKQSVSRHRALYAGLPRRR